MTATQDIFAAMDAGDRSQLESILRESPQLASARDSEGVPALLHALYRGRQDLVPVLLGAGQSLDLFEAAAVGRADRVREIVSADPATAREYTSDGFTALHYTAFFSGDLESARALIEGGADVGAVSRNPMRVQPLHSAVAGRKDDLAKLLVEKGADVNAQQERGFTPLMATAQHGDVVIAEYLLRHGADPAIATGDGRTAADFARAAGYEELARRLGGQ